jgi:hypothetical protein
MDANQASLRAGIKSGQGEMRSTENAYQEKMDALTADMKDGRKERTACQEATEANPEKMEPNPEMMQSVGLQQEVPKVEAAVTSSKALKKGHGGRKLAAEHHQKQKERTRGPCGSRKRLKWPAGR